MRKTTLRVHPLDLFCTILTIAEGHLEAWSQPTWTISLASQAAHREHEPTNYAFRVRELIDNLKLQFGGEHTWCGVIRETPEHGLMLNHETYAKTIYPDTVHTDRKAEPSELLRDSDMTEF